ncbi:MAG TPA: hypothetical protein VFV81_07235, partial [Verrucomicrobiae bacterium]|nr:hypothetical protein [Verrucomicrobiae bacterium]
VVVSRNQCLSNFIRAVILPQNRMYGGGNWGQCGAASAMAAGVFMEDQAVFNEAMNSLKYGAATECDMGIVNYINPAGWTDESDRDIGHWGLGLENITEAEWTAWCQGIDLWTFLNNRVLTAHEYLAYFNANNTTNGGLAGLTNVLAPYVPGNQCDGPANSGLISQTANALANLGTWYPFWEQALAPYQNMIGLAAPWTSNAVVHERPEGYDRDHIAFGTLVAAMPPLPPGLPIMPSGLVATWSNAQVNLAWESASNAAAYYVKRALLPGGPYTNLTAAMAQTNYTDSAVMNGVPYYYKVSATNAAGESVNSGLVEAYPSAAAPSAPVGLIAGATSHTRIDLSWEAVPGATSYIIKRSSSANGPFTPIAAGVGTIFLTYADTGLAPGTTYYYDVSATNSLGESVDSAPAAATTLPAPPSPWDYADAGYLTTPGNLTCSNGTFNVQGAGLDITGFGKSDSFGLAYVSLTGDGTIIARMVGRTNYSGLHKAGLTMRESLANGAKHFTTLFNGQNINSICYRSSTDGNSSTAGSAQVAGAFPQWQKITRVGNVFTGYASADGTNWTTLGSRTNSMNNTLLVGLAVCSRNNGALDTVVYDNVSVTGLWPALPSTPIGLAALPGDGEAILAWSDATNAAGYNLKRGTSGAGPFAVVATNLAGQVFTNTGLQNGALYYYVVSSTNYYGESADSSPAGVRPVSLTPPQVGLALAGAEMQFSWPTDHLGWILQSNSAGLANPAGWFDVPNSDNTNLFTVPVATGQSNVFFRLAYPAQ